MIIRRRITETAVKESQTVMDPALFISGDLQMMDRNYLRFWFQRHQNEINKKEKFLNPCQYCVCRFCSFFRNEQ